MTVYPLIDIPYSKRSDPDSQAYLMRFLTEYLPSRKLSEFLIKTHYYFDPTPDKSKAGFLKDSSIKKERSPWVIKLVFNPKKVSSTNNWRSIVDKLERKFYGLF